MLTCTFENGGKGNLRHVIVDAILLKENKILLVKRSPKIREGGLWGLVGGFMNRDENIEEALKREVFEETGYRLKTIKFLTVWDNPIVKGSDWQNIGFFYVCEVGEKQGEPDWESTEQKWFELDNLPKEEEFAFEFFKIINFYLKDKTNTAKSPVRI